MPSDQCHQGPLQFVSSSESYTIVKGEKEAWEITKLQLYDYTPKASLLLQVSNMNLPKNPKHERWYSQTTGYAEPQTKLWQYCNVVFPYCVNFKIFLGKICHRTPFFPSFAETHCLIVALPEHTLWPKMEKLLKTVRRIVIPSKMSNIPFLTMRCVLPNVT
jgi:hypothetical protein